MQLAPRKIIEFSELGITSISNGFLITLNNNDGDSQEIYIETKRQLVRFINANFTGNAFDE